MPNLPEKLYLAKQVQELDRIAIAQAEIPGIELMRRAGCAIFSTIQQYFQKHNIIIFCGAGNNAGDGYVVAKLALQAGFNIELYYLSDPKKLTGDAAIAFHDYSHIKGNIKPFKRHINLTNSIIIDALLGIGLNRDVTGDYAQAITLINQSQLPVISVDIPSGLNANTGNLMICAVKATYTVSFIGLKQGMFTGMAAEYCGKIIHHSLGIPEHVFQQVPHTAKLISHFKLAKRHRCSHKGNNGHVLLVGGDHGYSGAIKLAASASLRIGAGLVSIASKKSHSTVLNIDQPELMCHGVETTIELQVLINKATVIVIGPGLGLSPWANGLFKHVIKSNKPIVIDADALNLLANTEIHNDNWVLTPHPGEAARLLKNTTTDIANNRFLAVKNLQKTYGGVAILKGAGTLISNGTKIIVSNTGNPGMASGGMGDVLAGLIAGLIAQGLTLDKASASAVYLHGKAADLSAQQNGEIGLVASDLLPIIRKLVNE